LSEEESHHIFEGINAMSIHEHSRQIAITDDSCGTFMVPFHEDGQFDLSRPFRSLNRTHENIIGTIAFNPNHKRNEIFTGGYDCKVCVWDLTRYRPIRSIQLQAIEDTSTPTQVLNPPFVQCAGYMHDGKYVVCGLGDGSVSPIL
jgi:WD40 repeat protein